MRIAYLDCFAGIAGDMFLAALIDAGVPPQVLHEATAALGVGATLRIGKVDRSGISATKVDVLEGDRLAEQVPQDANVYTQQPKTQHLHKAGHTHSHDHDHSEATHTHEPHTHDDHAHSHGRSLTAIRSLIQNAPLAAPVKQAAIRAFELLGSSEAKIHNVPVDEIHFHEVGAIDAIVDIVAASAGIHHLNVGAWYCSPINVGGGTVVCAHGTFPVPAPATADLLRGLPTYSAHILNSMKLTAEDTPVGNSGSNVAGRIVSFVPEDIAGEINAALRNWRDALVSNDPARLADCYAGTVDRYFLQTNVTHDYVKQYIVNMHDRGDSVTDEGISQINLQRISASTVEARFIETFDSLAVGQDKKGTVRTILHFTKEVGAWKISYERQLNIPPEAERKNRAPLQRR
jgi:hypothetical protein